MLGNERTGLLQSILNESRASIIIKLLSGDKNIADLEKVLKLNRSTICYHLNILENVGILMSKYVILEMPHSMGRAGRVYSVNRGKLNEAIKAIEDFKKKISVWFFYIYCL